jgi:hypothetical protein
MTAADHVLWDLWIATFAATKAAFVVDSVRTVTGHQLTPEMCDQAERTGRSISGYLAAPWEDKGGFYTTVGAIDVDTTIEDARTIMRFLHASNVFPLMVRSRRGAHIWVWTVGDGRHQTEKYMPVPASRLRKGLQAAVDLSVPSVTCTYCPPEVPAHVTRAHIEVFPKRSASPLGVGALRMPLFKHPKTKRVYPVIAPDGSGETTDRLTAYHWTIDMDTPYEALYALGGMRTPPVTYPTALGRLRLPTATPEGPGVVAILASMGVDRATPGRNVRCPFHDDKHASLSISRDDQRVWCKAPSCPAYNGGRGLGSLALAQVRR